MLLRDKLIWYFRGHAVEIAAILPIVHLQYDLAKKKYDRCELARLWPTEHLAHFYRANGDTSKAAVYWQQIVDEMLPCILEGAPQTNLEVAMGNLAIVRRDQGSTGRGTRSSAPAGRDEDRKDGRQIRNIK